MSRMLMVYSTTDGHTRRICERLCTTIEADGEAVTLLPLAQAPAAELPSFERIVVGASIRYGQHSEQVADFVRANRRTLDRARSAFFSVNIVARKPDKSTPETNPYLKKFLLEVGWQPRATEVFAGKLDYPRYGPIDRTMIRLIMWITHGPTDPRAVVEFTDWNRVDAFAHQLARL